MAQKSSTQSMKVVKEHNDVLVESSVVELKKTKQKGRNRKETSKEPIKMDEKKTVEKNKTKKTIQENIVKTKKSKRPLKKKKPLEPIFCIPGQEICPVEEGTIAGDGTYEQKGYLYASLLGHISVRRQNEFKYIEVISRGRKTVVPLTGDIVTARVLLVNNRFAKCSILCVGDHVLDMPYRAVLRREEVRATEKDRIEMYKSYRPGDVILARVLPQTELSCYQLTTAENELGVVTAVASDNTIDPIPMVPISWTEMQCPNTLVKEYRKVAKVAPTNAVQ